MLSDIVTLIFSVLGMIYLLLSCVKRILLWRQETITVTVPLSSCDEGIFNKISNIRSICDFCGIQKKCTVVVINYGAPEWFCDKLKAYFGETDNLKIVNPENLITELHT